MSPRVKINRLLATRIVLRLAVRTWTFNFDRFFRPGLALGLDRWRLLTFLGPLSKPLGPPGRSSRSDRFGNRPQFTIPTKAINTINIIFMFLFVFMFTSINLRRFIQFHFWLTTRGVQPLASDLFDNPDVPNWIKQHVSSDFELFWTFN